MEETTDSSAVPAIGEGVIRDVAENRRGGRFDQESSARNDTNFVEISQEDEMAFQALEEDEILDDEYRNESDGMITVET